MIFVVPESHAQPCGGNLYNQLLLQALKKKGLRIQALSVGRALSGMKKAPVRSCWVDSLCLNELGHFLKLQGKEQKIYAVIHDLPSFEPGLSPSERRRREARENELLGRVSGFLVTSPWTRSVLAKRHLGRKPILVVPPAPAVLPSRPHRVGREFAGLMISNLIRRKGVLEFLDCLGRQVKKSDLFTLVIAGRSDIEPDYARRCLNLMVKHPCLKDKVKFLGALRPAQVKRCYESSSVFISSSRLETFGMAIQEARAFGLPVLALEAGYVRHHFSPLRRGLLFRSIPALARACAGYIRNPHGLEALNKTARLSIPRGTYTWEDAAQLFLDQLPR
ncbi:MAG: glycosyltransferase [Acidobacteriota bacterium]